MAVCKPDPLLQERERVWWTVSSMTYAYKPCPAALSVWSSYIPVFFHMIHHCLIAVLKQYKRVRTSFPRYCKNCKCFKNSFQGACMLCNRQFNSALFEIWLCHPANCILVGTACIHSTLPALVEVGLVCKTNFVVGVSIHWTGPLDWPFCH